ncbi:MAG: shikimate dehydrogenase [Gammaproteobacteria bacterium]|nr:shikimate dehydrogenase [Gammaproteobacteria bacterium]MCP5424057.1 shikimate dehydrogenase [Gammaproteobacteria bacterium]
MSETISGKADPYAVIGNPIGHSQSPRIHALFAAQTGQFMEYRAILAEVGEFAAAVDAFRGSGGRGLNVTVPFKQDAWVYADVLSARAERAGAVNTLAFREDGGAWGDNTDGVGLVRDLRGNYGFDAGGKRILILGAGGAARGIVQPLLGESPTQVVIANRTPDRAAQLALLFVDLGHIGACSFPELQGQSFDLIINATAAGLADQTPLLPEGVLAAEGWCYDLMYGGKPTAFVRWGRAHGAARSLDGLGMLVEQAAESFRLWRGVDPDTQAVLAALREGRAEPT